MRRLCVHLACFAILFGVPAVLFAQVNPPPKDATDLLNRISTYVINPIIYILFTVAFVVFVWGIVQFVGNLDNEEARSTGARHMIWGIIGMVIMVSVTSIVGVIQNTLRNIGG